MEATIVNYRRNSTGQKPNHLVVVVDGVDNRAKAEKFIGKSVTLKLDKKSLEGKINALHGNKGALRAVFSRGIPGQALGTKITIA